jgi:hypothetical protein
VNPSKALRLLPGLMLSLADPPSPVKRERRKGTQEKPGCWSGNNGGTVTAKARKARVRNRIARMSRKVNRRATR